ncbi:MAG: serine hydrolase [Acidobacteriota bacterium]
MTKPKIFRSAFVFALVFSLTFLPLARPLLAQSAGIQTAHASESSYSAALSAIESKTEARRKELGIPGMSLAIVKDGLVIFAKGFGYKDIAKKAPVTPDTLFAIGSATKAFTALSVLISQDEGKLSLDDSPKKALPYFKINDPEIDAAITIRDLLSHSSGLNRTDLGWITGKLNREEVIRVAGEAKPTAKLREKFQYQNVMFAAAGEIVAKVQNEAWEKFVPERIFAPLGMNESTMWMREMAKSKDYSFGYDYNFDTKETAKRPFRDIAEVSPAGSINSSANDMSKWLKFVMSGTTESGKRLVSEKGYEEWLKPQMKISANGKSFYGLGWFIQEWNGLKVIQHGGNIDGFNAMVAMIPEKKLGFVMLTNVSASSLGAELMPIVWSGILNENKPAESVKLPLKTMQFMVGKYHLESAGVDLEVVIEGEDLVLIVPGQPKYKLERTGPRQFKPMGAPEGFAVKFTPEQGDATEMFLQQPNRSDTLKRVAATGQPEAKPSAAAGELIGKYESEGNGQIVEIKDVDGKVSMVLPGQQPYALIEKGKDQYKLSPLPETYWLKVARDDQGKITKVIAVQPEGEFGFKSLAAVKPPMSVDEIMAKAIDAVGGEANLKKLKSRVATFETDLVNQGVKAYGTSYAKAPNMTATETTITALGKKIAQGFEYFNGTNGEESYTFAPTDKYTGKRLEDVRLGSDFYGALNWKTNYKKAEFIKTAKCGEEQCYAIAFEPEKGTKFTEYYSATTFLLLKREGLQASSTSSVEIPYKVTYEDYRPVDGVKMPFKTTSSSVSNGDIVTIIKTVKHNVPIEDSVFRPRKVE